MPLHDYQCQVCHHEFESISDGTPINCEKCTGQSIRLWRGYSKKYDLDKTSEWKRAEAKGDRVRAIESQQLRDFGQDRKT